MRGDLSETASMSSKVRRVLAYYVRLLLYVVSTRANLFHILWNNKFEIFDRVPLMLYYRLLGKKILLTVHNVNKGERDANDSWLNRMTLRFQYQFADHLFVHTERMKHDLSENFGICVEQISVIPFGINNAVPHTDLSPEEARRRLGISELDRTILFFGNIAPYKGLEFLIEAFRLLVPEDNRYRLIIAGSPKNCEAYWSSIRTSLVEHLYRDRILQRTEFIPDCETEIYFKAADVVVLPYRHIFQSGVLSLGYSFGLPVIASDVGSLREDIIEGKTGFVCKPEDSKDLAMVIQKYFVSDLYYGLDQRRQEIRGYASKRYSWETIGDLTIKTYKKLMDSQRVPARLGAAR
jgi:D-inositol-3-phosphate glycosyltransferase